MKNYMYECIDEADKRYQLKRERLVQVKEIIRKAINAACRKAEEIYSDSV